MTNPIYPCLWFNNNAKQAAEFYCTVFENGKILQENPTVVVFELNDTKFMGLNGGALYQHSPAVSFVIECDSQEQIDHYWAELGKNGRYDQCGWLADQFGISWQIVPKILSKLMADPEKGQRVVQAFMKMQKFDIETLLNA
jgi:predicted 3-demethylubiquinone-9 3-methyltransferase (glyoxalase superfamily)